MTTTNTVRAALDAAAIAGAVPAKTYIKMCNALAPHTLTTCHAHPTRQAHTFDSAHRPVCGACAVTERGL